MNLSILLNINNRLVKQKLSNYTSSPNNIHRLSPLSQDTISFSAKFPSTEEIEAEIKAKKKELGDLVECKNIEDVKKIFDILGFKQTKINKDNLLTINKYEQPSKHYTFKDLGIDENKLFQYIQIIKYTANLNSSNVTNLGNLEIVNKDIEFPSDSQITNFGNLRRIGGGLYGPSQAREEFKQHLAKLAQEDLKDYLECETIEDIKKILDYTQMEYQITPDNLIILNPNYKSQAMYDYSAIGVNEVNLYKKIKEYKGDINLENKENISFDNLEKAFRISLKNCKNIDFKNLKQTDSIRIFNSSNINLDSLKEVRYLQISKSSVNNLSNLSTIKEGYDFSNSTISEFYKELYKKPKNKPQITSSCRNCNIINSSENPRIKESTYEAKNALLEKSSRIEREKDIEKLKEKYNNGNFTQEQLEDIIETTYKKHRKVGEYAIEYENDLSRQIINQLIKKISSNPRLYNFELSIEGGWGYRIPHGMSNDIIERISLDVKADPGLIDELDNLMVNGEYEDKNGEKKEVSNLSHFYYKTYIDPRYWNTRKDPITLYFEDEINDETLEAITEIAYKYQRKQINQDISNTCVNNKDNYCSTEDYIAVEKSPTRESIDKLIKRATKLGPVVQDTIKKFGYSLTSAGLFQSCNAVLDELECTFFEHLS